MDHAPSDRNDPPPPAAAADVIVDATVTVDLLPAPADVQQQQPSHEHEFNTAVEHQQQQSQEQQHEPVNVLNGHHAQQQHHDPHGMATLQGTEVAHIANMDASAPEHQQQHQLQHEPVNHVNVSLDQHPQPQQQHTHVDAAGTGVGQVQQVQVMEPNPVSVPIPEPNPVNVNVNVPVPAPVPVEVSMHQHQHEHQLQQHQHHEVQVQHEHQHQHHPPLTQVHHHELEADHSGVHQMHIVGMQQHIVDQHQHQHPMQHQHVEVQQHDQVQVQQVQVQQLEHAQQVHEPVPVQVQVHHAPHPHEAQVHHAMQHPHQVHHHDQQQQVQVQVHPHHEQQVQVQVHHDQTHVHTHPHAHGHAASAQVHAAHPHHTVTTMSVAPAAAPPPQLPPLVEKSWHDFFIEFQSHYTNYNTLDIDPGFNPPLEAWVAEQRALYQEDKKGHETTLTAERRLLLDALGFEWEPPISEEPEDQQQQVVDVNGNPIPQQQQEDGSAPVGGAEDGTTMDASGVVVEQQGGGDPNQHVMGQVQQQHEQHMHAHGHGHHEQHQQQHHDAAALDAQYAQDVAAFNARLGQLQQFKEIHGHASVPSDYKEEDDLGKWAMEQRDLYSKNTLTQDRVDALVTMGFDFQVDTDGSGSGKIPFFTFDERIQQLVEYKEHHGHIMIPRKCDPLLQGLGEWLHIQKRLIRRVERGEQTVLTQERLKILLDDLGIDMSTLESEERAGPASTTEMTEDDKDSNRTSKWEEKYHELKLYKDVNGHTNVPRRSKRDPSKDTLGEWVHFQRRQHRNLLTGKNSTMSIGRKKALDYIDFQWTRTTGPSTTTRNGTTYSTDLKTALDAQILNISVTENPENWNERFAEFQNYVQTHGNANVPKNYRENPFLGRWVSRQRELYETCRPALENPELRIAQESEDIAAFTKERYEKLVAAGFIFEKTIPSIEGDGTEVPVGEDGSDAPVADEAPDDVEIFIGYEELEPPLSQGMDANAHPPQTTEVVPVMHTLEQQVAATEPAPVTAAEEPKQMELNESEVHAILEGKEEQEPQQHTPMEHVHEVPMPTINNQEEVNVEMQNVEPNSVEMQEQEAQMQVAHPASQDQVLPTEPVIDGAPPRRLTTRVKVDWEERVLELIQFKLRKTHCNVPAKWKPNPDLADWVWRQRAQYRLYRQNQPSSLNATRITKLADLGFEFVALDHNGLPMNEIDSKLYSSQEIIKIQPVAKKSPKRKGTPKSRFKEGKWLESLAKVVKYKEDTGNCNVPRKWKKDPTLGEWVHFQRRQFRLRQLNRRNHMTDERIRKLEAVGFEWTRGTNSQPSYIRLYEQNKELAAQTGLQQSENHVAEEAAMNSSEVPTDVTQIAVMDGEEQVKAAEIAAVVEEQLNNPADAAMQQVENQQQITDHQAHEGQDYSHEQHQHLHVTTHEEQHQQVIDEQQHPHLEGVVGHEQLHHYSGVEDHQQHSMEEAGATQEASV